MMTNTGVGIRPHDVRQICCPNLIKLENAYVRCQTWGSWHVPIILRKQQSVHDALGLVAEKVPLFGAARTCRVIVRYSPCQNRCIGNVQNKQQIVSAKNCCRTIIAKSALTETRRPIFDSFFRITWWIEPQGKELINIHTLPHPTV